MDETWHNSTVQDTVPSQPSIQFQGSQRLLSIHKVNVPNQGQTFNFHTSDVGSDTPQGSFDCVQQAQSSSGASRLSKITVCATSDSSQTTRDGLSQAEEEWCNPSAKVTNVGRPLLGKRPLVRKARESSLDFLSERKRTAPLKPATLKRKTQTPGLAVSQQLYRERVMHLLALRSYTKLELLARLEKDGVNQRDKNCLGSILQQVANLNQKDNSYTLKENLYLEIQRNWPGYTEIEKQSLKLKRSLYLSQHVPGTGHEKGPVVSGMDGPSTSKKRPLNSGYVDPLIKKRRISRVASGPNPLFSGQSSASTAPSPPPTLHFTVLSTSSPLLAASSGSPSTSEGRGTRELPADCSSQRSQSSTSSRPGEGVEETHTASKDPPSCSEPPDYILKYTPVESYRQWESYKDDFDAQYGEYRALHAWVESVTQRFLELDAQRKLLSPGTKEHQMLDEEILEEYRKIKQSTPSYYQQKSRCEYLHNKLSHIKRLVEDFNRQRAELWHQSLTRKR